MLLVKSWMGQVNAQLSQTISWRSEQLSLLASGRRCGPAKRQAQRCGLKYSSKPPCREHCIIGTCGSEWIIHGIILSLRFGVKSSFSWSMFPMILGSPRSWCQPTDVGPLDGHFWQGSAPHPGIQSQNLSKQHPAVCWHANLPVWTREKSLSNGYFVNGSYT